MHQGIEGLPRLDASQRIKARGCGYKDHNWIYAITLWSVLHCGSACCKSSHKSPDVHLCDIPRTGRPLVWCMPRFGLRNPVLFRLSYNWLGYLRDYTEKEWEPPSATKNQAEDATCQWFPILNLRFNARGWIIITFSHVASVDQTLQWTCMVQKVPGPAPYQVSLECLFMYWTETKSRKYKAIFVSTWS